MTYRQYEQAMEEARGDADAMLGASLLRIRALERVLAELVDTTNAMSPVDHGAFQKACDMLPPKQDGKEASDPSNSRPLSWCGNEGEYDPEALGSDAWLTGCPCCGTNCCEKNKMSESELVDILVAKLDPDKQDNLDELVHEIKAGEASELNNCGSKEQVRYLVELLGPEEASEAIRNL